MGKNSKIQWTDHTFNLVWGCVKVNSECKNCYAEAHSKRYGYDCWGPNTERRTFLEKYWNAPLLWNKKAQVADKQQLVFCGSMCDWLEDHPTVHQERKKLLPLISNTPWLTWLLLSKRIENFIPMVIEQPRGLRDLPRNIMLGISAGTQATYDEKWPILAGISAGINIPTFISVEPMLEPIDLNLREVRAPDWIIIGGESGHKARKMSVKWVLDILKQIDEYEGEIPIFVKQLGSWWAKHAVSYKDDPKGEVMELWPYPLQIREYPDEAYYL